jgi:hypothetical protein
MKPARGIKTEVLLEQKDFSATAFSGFQEQEF